MPTTKATGIHTGASAVSTTHNTEYVEMVMIRRHAADTEVECENASTCTNRERRRKSVGRTMLRCCRDFVMGRSGI